jgi:hypothetical protein
MIAIIGFEVMWSGGIKKWLLSYGNQAESWRVMGTLREKGMVQE